MANYIDAIQRFGLLTVFNAYCVPVAELVGDSTANAYFKGKTIEEARDAILAKYEADATHEHSVYLDTLKMANITQEGPSKTVTGGQYANPLIKYGKTARCEMQDALGNAKALEILGGAVYDNKTGTLAVTDRFPGPVSIVGDVFIIDQKTGDQVKVHVVIPQYLPDAVLSFNFDAEGDATVFDLNGDVLATDMIQPDKANGAVYIGMCDQNSQKGSEVILTKDAFVVYNNSVTYKVPAGYTTVTPSDSASISQNTITFNAPAADVAYKISNGSSNFTIVLQPKE